MSDFIAFGSPETFEIAFRYRMPRDGADRQPLGYGWSFGDLRITVAGHVVTENHRGTMKRGFATWYLLPFFDWLADAWPRLLHEQDYSWREKSAAPAAVAAPRVLQTWAGADGETARQRYGDAQGWRANHAVRAAASGGLWPDLYCRRYFDMIEVSWTNTPPVHSPPDFCFVVRPGLAYLPVGFVAEPLWQALNHFAFGDIFSIDDDAGAQASQRLKDRISEIAGLNVIDLASRQVQPRILSQVQRYFQDHGADSALIGRMVANDVPAVAEFPPAIAMFGGVSPDLNEIDVNRLAAIVVQRLGVIEDTALGNLVSDRGGPPERAPYLEGYDLAEELADIFSSSKATDHVDVRALIADLGIEIVEELFETDTIRGVALAGDGLGPTIVINTNSRFNVDEEGRRFTLAHELCHLLYDRGHARAVGITSGPWAPGGVERRANAFAAMLLMPRGLLTSALAEASDAQLSETTLLRLAGRLHVSKGALVEHLYNLDLIDEFDRARLRRRLSLAG